MKINNYLPILYQKIVEKKELKNFRKNINASHYHIKAVKNNTKEIKKNDIVSISSLYNERSRIKRFIEHQRSIGVDHMIFIDNFSIDDPFSELLDYEFCSVFQTSQSYNESRAGVLWFNYLLHKYALNHWVIYLDLDEDFIYPYCDTRNIHELVEYLEKYNKNSIPCTMVDLYVNEESNNFYFDKCGYFYFVKNSRLYVRGGPRVRVFNHKYPGQSPNNIKFPLIKLSKYTFYKSSSHQIYPLEYCKIDKYNFDIPTGVIAHYKFDSQFINKVNEEIKRNEHYGSAMEYKIYAKKRNYNFYNYTSCLFENWRSFMQTGLMSYGRWF